MPTKPVVTPEIFAPDLNYSTLTGSAAVKNGTPTKVDGGAGFRAEGSKLGSPAPAQLYNNEFNTWSQFVRWVWEGTSAADEDAHIVETEADGRLRAAFGQFADGAAAHPVVQIAVDGSNDGIVVTGGGAATADYAIDVDMSSVTSNGTGLRIQGAPAKPAIDISSQGAVPAMLVSSDGVTVPPSQPDTGVSVTSSTGNGILATCFGAGNAGYFANTSTGSALKIESTGGGGGTVGVVEIESDRTVPAINVMQTGNSIGLLIDSSHAGGSTAISVSYNGTSNLFSGVHTGSSGSCVNVAGSVSSSSAVVSSTALNTGASAVLGTTAAAGLAGAAAIRGNASGAAYGVFANVSGSGYAGIFSQSGTGSTIRGAKGSNFIELVTNDGSTAHMTSYTADPAVSGTVNKLWPRDFTGIHKLAATYVSGTGRVLINASKYGHVYAITDELSGSFAETTAPSTYSVPGGTCSWEDDAFPISVAGDVYWRVTGRIRRSTIGTMPEVFNIGVMPYDVTSSANMYGTLTGVPVDFVNTAGGEHWVHFVATGVYTLPAIGSRQFQVRFEQQGGGGTTNGVCSFANVVMEVWQPQHNA